MEIKQQQQRKKERKENAQNIPTNQPAPALKVIRGKEMMALLMSGADLWTSEPFPLQNFQSNPVCAGVVVFLLLLLLLFFELDFFVYKHL